MYKPNYIICMVDIDNTYDYETAGAWTDDIEIASMWQRLGIQNFVLLDPLSLELVATYDNAEMEIYIQGVKEL